MKTARLVRTTQIVVLLLAASLVAVADGPQQNRFRGIINDYSPAAVSPTGPWEVRGTWTLAVKGDSGKADFSAALTMVRSDAWLLAHPDDPSGRTHHTHHISLTDAAVTPIANGFRVTGNATIIGNGTAAGFSPSQLQIDVTGGADVPASNITLTFSAPAANHFGGAPLIGVVRSRR